MTRNWMIHLTAVCCSLLLVSVSVAEAKKDDRSSSEQSRAGNDRAEKAPKSNKKANSKQETKSNAYAETRESSETSKPADSRMRAVPKGWVRIAMDYNNDGRFDAVESIFFFDLDRARRTSRERASLELRQSRKKASRATDRRVEGEIEELRYEQLAGAGEKCAVARLAVRDGETRKICLGPKSQLEKLDLQKGDRLVISTVRGHINDRAMLFAHQVSKGDQKAAIKLPAGRFLKRVRGELLSMRSVKFRGHDSPHVVAELALTSGRLATANLGPQSMVEKLELEKGAEISMLARPGRVNGEAAMVAEKIWANDSVVDLPRPDQSQHFRRNTQRQAEDSDRKQGKQNERKDGESKGQKKSSPENVERKEGDATANSRN